LVLTMEKILDVREKTLRHRVIQEYLVRWKDLPTEDATWEGEQILQHLGFELVGDNQSWEGSIVMSPSN